MATDGKFEAVVAVDVHVLDVNDNSPVCEQVRGSLQPFRRTYPPVVNSSLSETLQPADLAK